MRSRIRILTKKQYYIVDADDTDKVCFVNNKKISWAIDLEVNQFRSELDSKEGVVKWNEEFYDEDEENLEDLDMD